jgi:spore coat polysaccharide biosynthesis protein SpsF
VTPYIYQHPARFRLANLESPLDEANRRWTVDTPDDLRFISAVMAELQPNLPGFRLADVRNVLARRPQLEEINRNVVQKRIDETRALAIDDA